MSNKKLKPSYAPPGQQAISAYSDTGHDLKTQFLKDARALLKNAASQVGGNWLYDVRVGKGGIAVGGEAYLDMKKISLKKALHVCISSSAIVGRDSDHVYTYAQIRSNDERRSILAGNFEIDPNLDGDGLAKQLRWLLKRCEE